MKSTKHDLHQGALDLLILKVVALGPVHGYAIAQRLEQVSHGVVQVPQGSLYPALQRLENCGLLAGDWGWPETGRRLSSSGLNRKGGTNHKRKSRGGGSWDRPCGLSSKSNNGSG